MYLVLVIIAVCYYNTSVRRERQFSFIILLFIAFWVFFLSQTGILTPIQGLLETAVSPLGSFYGIFPFLKQSTTSRYDLLLKENEGLVYQLVKQNELLRENAALKSQFQETPSYNPSLLPALVIGQEGFLPGSSAIDTMIIDKGSSDGVRKGSAILVGRNALGLVSEVSPHRAKITLLTHQSSSVPASVTNPSQGIVGIVKGEGGGSMVLDNVLLSQTLMIGDIVVTKGSETLDSEGFLPNLVIGKIRSVNRQPSELFQTAHVQSFVDPSTVSTVFVVTQ